MDETYVCVCVCACVCGMLTVECEEWGWPAYCELALMLGHSLAQGVPGKAC